MRTTVRMMKRLAVTALVGAAVLGGMPVRQAEAKPDQLTIYGGPLNTSWYVIAGWLATELQKHGVKANSELGGALSNIIQVSRGPANMGLTFAASTQMAREGEKPFPKPIDNFCAIQIYQSSMFHAMVSKASGIDTVAGLKGQKYSGQAVGNLSQLALKHYLQVNGLAEDDLDIAIGGQQFGADGVKDRRFVGFAAMTAVPSPPMMDAATSVPVKFLPVDDEMFAKLQKINGGYARAEIPAGAYPGVDEPVPSFGTVAFIMMNTASSEDDQYFVTRTIHENWDGLKAAHASTRFLTKEKAVDVPGTDLCPGARKYWTEQGAL